MASVRPAQTKLNVLAFTHQPPDPGPRRNAQPNLGPTPFEQFILKQETGSVTPINCGVRCGVQIGIVIIHDSDQWFTAEFGILSLRHTPLSLSNIIA